MQIGIRVDWKSAVLSEPVTIVCNNSDYQISVNFSSEWAEIQTAVITYWYHGEKVTIEKLIFRLFDLDRLPNVDSIQIVFRDAQEHETYPLTIPCAPSIICEESTEYTEHDDVYNELMQQYNGVYEYLYISAKTGAILTTDDDIPLVCVKG